MIINDPVHGFINIDNPFIKELLNHYYVQRLRNISQTGLAKLIYPGLNNSRFNHSIGCLHIMQKVISILRYKKVEITYDEEEALLICILLHDIGHGPFSHSLEGYILEGFSHENISLRLIERLNKIYSKKLDLAIKIFQGRYHKLFLTQLITSQIDIDRLDYIKRDSFFSGVVEGNINPDRIISMMSVVNNNLVIYYKGLPSIEKFLISRTFMYTEVYKHKKSIAAENLLQKVIQRARYLHNKGINLYITPELSFLFKKQYSNINIISDEDLDVFTNISDDDIYSCIKQWINHPDYILQKISYKIVNSILENCYYSNNKCINFIKKINCIKKKYNINENDLNYFINIRKIKFLSYNLKYPINILFKNGDVKELSQLNNIFRSFQNNSIFKYHYHIFY